MFVKPFVKAFTLVELLIVLSLIIILSLITIPSFTSFFASSRLSNSAENLYYFLQNARLEAIKQNQTSYVSVNTSSWCYGANVGSACDCTAPSTCALGTVTRPTSSNVLLSASGLSSSSMSFEGSRGAAGNISTFTFSINGQPISMQVKVTVLGNVQLCSTGISGYTSC